MLGAKLKDFLFIRRTAEDGYAIKVPVFSPPYGGFSNVDKSLGPEAACAFRYGARRMKSTGNLPAGRRAIYFIKDLKEEPAPSGDAGFCHCEVRLCGPWQVYGESSIYLSR